jgi:hypothetical protein
MAAWSRLQASPPIEVPATVGELEAELDGIYEPNRSH